jgi:hypothetical protein
MLYKQAILANENTISLIFIYKFIKPQVKQVSTHGVSTLSWWWDLSAPETLRAMPAVA